MGGLGCRLSVSRDRRLFQFHGEQAGDAVAAHRYAVDHLRRGHGHAIVRNHNKLCALGEPFQDIAEADNIRFVEGRIDLVEQAEGGWVDL